jgi:uncharacterized membrane protein
VPKVDDLKTILLPWISPFPFLAFIASSIKGYVLIFRFFVINKLADKVVLVFDIKERNERKEEKTKERKGKTFMTDL